MVRVPDCRSGGCGFESRPPRLRALPCGALFVFGYAWGVSLVEITSALERRYGRPPRPVVTDPWGMILLHETGQQPEEDRILVIEVDKLKSGLEVCPIFCDQPGRSERPKSKLLELECDQ